MGKMGLFAASGMLAPVAGGYDLEHVGSRSKLTALTVRGRRRLSSTLVGFL